MFSKVNKNLQQPQYFARPQSAVEAEEKASTVCKYFFGYLIQRGKGEKVPEDCIECRNVLDCMNSKEIKCSQPYLRDLPESIKEPSHEIAKTPATAVNVKVQRDSAGVVAAGPPVVLRCKRWEDFQEFAFQAKTVSFMRRESDGVFEADALTNNQIVVYTGEVPRVESLLKLWLSRQLEIPEEKVFKGIVSRL